MTVYAGGCWHSSSLSLLLATCLCLTPLFPKQETTKLKLLSKIQMSYKHCVHDNLNNTHNKCPYQQWTTFYAKSYDKPSFKSRLLRKRLLHFEAKLQLLPSPFRHAINKFSLLSFLHCGAVGLGNAWFENGWARCVSKRGSCCKLSDIRLDELHFLFGTDMGKEQVGNHLPKLYDD